MNPLPLKTLSFCCILTSSALHAQDSIDNQAELAKKLSNPVASLISVPLQNNVDFGSGAEGDGVRYTLNFQPVIPFHISPDWNLISRTIIPYIYQEDILGRTSQSGLSDTVQSLFLSPAQPTASGIIWGAGPVFLLPTATDDLLGTEKFGLGPTVVLLKQSGPWTVGILANHLWSVAGDQARQDLNATFLNPFVSYQFPTYTTATLTTESTYDWENEQWTVPLAASVSQIVKIGGQPVSFTIGGRYYADKPANGPEWGLRFSVTLLFPTGEKSNPSPASQGTLK